MSAQDMRDMLGLGGDGARPPPSKKQKTVDKRPLEKGIAREVSALMGERAPPIAMIQVQPKYKQRPRRSHRAAPWEWAPFPHQARADGLVLHHWQRKQPPKSSTQRDQQPPESGGDAEKVLEPEQREDKQYQFAKYDVHVETPAYDQSLYDSQLHDADWSKEETDYLVSTVGEYGQKWPVVFDRYAFRPAPGQNGQQAQQKSRSLEDLKARYYTVSAKVLANHTPISSMTAPQYNLYSTLTSFNPVQETSRKKLAEGHLYRSQLEVEEENILLAELQRIMVNQQQLENERKEIRDRLEYPVATSSAAGAQYSTSQQLGQLFQQLLQADRLKKDRRLKALTDHPATANAAQLQTAAAAAAQTGGHRDSIGSASAAARKSGARDSLSATDTQRALTPHAMSRYFVTTHDRLSSGVSFASDRLHRARSAKSVAQTDRINAILAHVKIPDVIPLPTQKVIDEFEKLMQKVHLLLDMRKNGEKEEQEIKVKEAEKRVREEKEGLKVEGDEGKSRKRSGSVMSEAQSVKRARN